MNRVSFFCFTLQSLIIITETNELFECLKLSYSGGTNWCSAFKYSGVGQVNCEDKPTFLRFTNTNNRYETAVTTFGLGYAFNGGNNDGRTNCGTE